uniref:Uncharacterized protein n=1 Tax=Anopheles farauti TaxID=69004 RepID=A0A182QLF4_9DIPT
MIERQSWKLRATTNQHLKKAEIKPQIVTQGPPFLPHRNSPVAYGPTLSSMPGLGKPAACAFRNAISITASGSGWCSRFSCAIFRAVWKLQMAGMNWDLVAADWAPNERLWRWWFEPSTVCIIGSGLGPSPDSSSFRSRNRLIMSVWPLPPHCSQGDADEIGRMRYQLPS